MQEPTDPRRAMPTVAELPVPRCGYCDDPVDPTLYLPCPTCGAHAHDHCLVQHGGCPTPGCEVTGPVARATVAARTLPPVERVSTYPLEVRSIRVRRGISLVGGFTFSLGAGGVLISLVAMGSSGGVLLGAAGLVIATTFVALGSWLHSLVSLFAGRRAPPSLRLISTVLAAVCLGGGVVGVLASAVGLGVLESALASSGGLRQVLAAGTVLVSGALLVLSGGLNLAGLALDSARHAP